MPETVDETPTTRSRDALPPWNYIDAAQLGKRGSCHLFRHTMATLLREHGCDIRYIQAMLGHAELSTTQIYTQVSIKKLKEIHSATHPSARLHRRPLHRASGEPPPTEEELLAELEAEAAEEAS